MTTTAELADFLETVSYDALPADVVDATKKRLLDSVGIALGAVGDGIIETVQVTVRETGGTDCSLWATDASASLSGAAMYNTTLTRYLDFMDSFLAPGETPHPSDNVGIAVAAAEVCVYPEDSTAGTACAREIISLSRATRLSSS